MLDISYHTLQAYLRYSDRRAREQAKHLPAWVRSASDAAEPMPRVECDPWPTPSLRFDSFAWSRPSPRSIVWTFVVIVAVGVTGYRARPSRSAGAMVPVLLLQLFAASSGFEVPARRGHYDLLLTSGHHRIWMALVHWAHVESRRV